MSKVEFVGGCHCGKVRYQVALALSTPPLATRCNCTICLKSGWTSVSVATPADFKLLQPAAEKDLGDYQINSTKIHHFFCRNCGIPLYGHGTYEFDGHEVNFFSVNIPTLDQPQEGLDLSKFTIEYWDGRNDNWGAGKKTEPWSGGLL